MDNKFSNVLGSVAYFDITTCRFFQDEVVKQSFASCYVQQERPGQHDEEVLYCGIIKQDENATFGDECLRHSCVAICI